MNLEITDTIYCEQCGAQNRSAAKYCRSCGKKFEILVSDIQPAISTKEANSDRMREGQIIDPAIAKSIDSTQVLRVRPWVRFFARVTDFTLLIYFLAIPVYVFFPTLPSLLYGLFIRALLVFVESYLLSEWGTTPGKWLLKTTVTDLSGNKLSYKDALSRSLAVWLKGDALGIPVFESVANAIAYQKLVNDNSTTWDRQEDYDKRADECKTGGCFSPPKKYIVLHEPLDFARTSATVLIFVGSILLSMFSEFL